MKPWPDPNASRETIAAFVRENAPPAPPAHEAPEVSNGPSIVCNACGIVRVSLLTPFCRACRASLKAAGVL